MNFTANFKGNKEVNYDEDSENFIRISNSTFHNNAFQTVIQALSLKQDSTEENTQEEFVNSVSFKKFKDQGLILNTNGYSGSI